MHSTLIAVMKGLFLFVACVFKTWKASRSCYPGLTTPFGAAVFKKKKKKSKVHWQDEPLRRKNVKTCIEPFCRNEARGFSTGLWTSQVGSGMGTLHVVKCPIYQ